MQPSAISHQPARSPGGRADAHPVHLQLAPAPGERQRLWQALARLARLRGSTSLHAQAPALAPAGGMQAVCSNGISRWHRHQQHLPRSAACISASLGPGPMILLPVALDAPPTHTPGAPAPWRVVVRAQRLVIRAGQALGEAVAHPAAGGPAGAHHQGRRAAMPMPGISSAPGITSTSASCTQPRPISAARRPCADRQQQRVGSHIDPTCCAARSARASPRG